MRFMMALAILVLALALKLRALFYALPPPLAHHEITLARTEVRMKQADDLIPVNDPQSKHLTLFLIPEMPVLLIIKRTISAPPLQVANVQIIAQWVA